MRSIAAGAPPLVLHREVSLGLKCAFEGEFIRSPSPQAARRQAAVKGAAATVVTAAAQRARSLAGTAAAALAGSAVGVAPARAVDGAVAGGLTALPVAVIISAETAILDAVGDVLSWLAHLVAARPTRTAVKRAAATVRYLAALARAVAARRA